MNRRTYLNTIKILAVFIVAYIVYVLIVGHINMNKLSAIENSFVFQLDSIVNISKDRITQEYTIYNEDKLLAFDCIIDSSYFLSLVKIGRLDGTFDTGLIFVNDQFIEEKAGWFKQDRVYAVTPNMMRYFVPYYNVSTLPMIKVSNVEMYVDGDILSEPYINKNMIIYSVKALSASFSFNKFQKWDLIYAYAYSNIDNPSLTNILFCHDMDNNLYIGTFSTMKGVPKTLLEILDE